MNQYHFKRETEIYDDISAFIQLFRRSLSVVETAMQHSNQQVDLAIIIPKLKENLYQYDMLASRYSQQSQNLTIEQNTFHRFANRLIEVIAIYKIKYQNSNQSALGMSKFLTVVKDLQESIKKYENGRMFKKIISHSHLTFLKIYIYLESSSDKKCEDRVDLSAEIDKANFLSQNLNDKNCNSYDGKLKWTWQQNQMNEAINKEKRLEVVEQKNGIGTVTKTLSEINKRFDVLKCLDVDYQYFKGSAYEARQNDSLFIRDYLFRNETNDRAIKNYKDDFDIFEKKKQVKMTRRNKKIVTNDLELCPSNISVDYVVDQKSIKPKQHLRYRKNKTNQTMDQKNIVQAKEATQKTQVEENCNQVQSLPLKKAGIKHFYLTMGKKMNKLKVKNFMPFDGVQQQKNVLQSHPINLSFYNIDGVKSTPGIIKCKVKLKEQSQSVKTVNERDFLIQKSLKGEKCKVKAKAIVCKQKQFGKQQSGLLSPNRRQFKSNVLEINCLRAMVETNNKSLLLINKISDKLINKNRGKAIVINNNSMIQIQQT